MSWKRVSRSRRRKAWPKARDALTPASALWASLFLARPGNSVPGRPFRKDGTQVGCVHVWREEGIHLALRVIFREAFSFLWCIERLHLTQ